MTLKSLQKSFSLRDLKCVISENTFEDTLSAKILNIKNRINKMSHNVQQIPINSHQLKAKKIKIFMIHLPISPQKFSKNQSF